MDIVVDFLFSPRSAFKVTPVVIQMRSLKDSLHKTAALRLFRESGNFFFLLDVIYIYFFIFSYFFILIFESLDLNLKGNVEHYKPTAVVNTVH